MSEPAASPPIHPFPGLRAFEESEDFLFFGRDGQSEDILAAMRRARLLAVVGPSGSGKSSLIRAGLIPHLHGGFLEASTRWRIAVMRPGADPIGALARAIVRQGLLAPAPEDPAETHKRVLLTLATLRRGGLGLADTVKLARLPANDAVLVVVDQFEELFRFREAAGARAADEAAAFVKLLIEASRQTALPIYVVLTMRSDFIGDCARFRDLPETVTRGLYLVPRLTRAQRRAVIEGPVRVAGGAVTPRLVTRVLNDIGDDPDQLPILQHAMMRAWDHWSGRTDEARPLDLEDYEAIGGAARALSNHADEVFEKLDARGREIAERLFQALTEKDSDNRESRRPTKLSAIAAAVDADQAGCAAVVEAFRAAGQSFLMPPPPVALEAETVIDISHESLIRGWRRLGEWVEEEAESARVFKRLSETAALAALGKAGLWRDPDLSVALAWRERVRPTAAWGERYSGGFDVAIRFLEDSRAARDAAARAEAQARRAQLRRARVLVAVSVVALVVFAALGSLSYIEAQKERASAARALEQTQRAEEATRIATQEKATAEAALAQAEAATSIANAEKANAKAALSRAEQATEVANAEKAHAKAAQARAESERARAEGEARDLIADTDRARAAEINLATVLQQTATEAQSYSPPEVKQRLADLVWRAEAITGDFAAARKLHEEQQEQGLHPTTSHAMLSYISILQADPDTSIRESRAYLEKYASAAVSANLATALMMKGDYGGALKALDEGLSAKTTDQYIEDRDVAPDIQAATHHRVLYANGSDILLVLLYFKAFLFGSEDEDGFDGFIDALKAADVARARDYGGAGVKSDPTEATAPLLFALNIGWLGGRGQATNLPGEPGPDPRNYGLFAAQGALWERAAALQSRYGFAARRAYEAFEAAYAARPEPRYARLHGWVERQLARPEIRDAVDEYVPPDASALRLQAEELHARAGGQSYVDIAPALERLSWAIAMLESATGERDGQQKRLLANLYWERGLWRYQAQDYAGARADAELMLGVDPSASTGYLLRGLGWSVIDPAKAEADYETAIKLTPYNTDAIESLIAAVRDKDANHALQLIENEQEFGYLWEWEYETAADLHRRGKDYPAALSAVAKAIAYAPEKAALCETKRAIESEAGTPTASALAREAACLRTGGDWAARIGHSDIALKLYIQTLRVANAEGAENSDDAAFESEADSRTLSAFLSQRFGADSAKAFWSSVVAGHDREPVKRQARKELARLGTN